VVDGASALVEVNSMFDFTPDFIVKFPDSGRAGAWRQMRDLQVSPKTALSGKTKELIGLAVAAMVPCRCIVAHTELAKLNGATDLEIREAVAMASHTRNFSTLLNGLQVDEGQFRRDVERLVRGARAAAAKRAAKTVD
jgi:AhpD family alkylhydroperoxidase